MATKCLLAAKLMGNKMVACIGMNTLIVTVLLSFFSACNSVPMGSKSSALECEDCGDGEEGEGGRLSYGDLATALYFNFTLEFDGYHGSGVDDSATAIDNFEDARNNRPASRSSYGNAPGGTVWLDQDLLDGLNQLSDDFSYSISECAGGSHSVGSAHYQGKACDFYKINGRPANASNPDVDDFRDACLRAGARRTFGPGDAGHAGHVHCEW